VNHPDDEPGLAPAATPAAEPSTGTGSAQ